MTEYGVPCPACDGKEKTKYVALLPLEDGTPPHRYAIGTACYRKQWKEVYPKEKCPVYPEKKCPA